MAVHEEKKRKKERKKPNVIRAKRDGGEDVLTA